MRSIQALRGSKHKVGVFALMFAAYMLLFLPGCQAPTGPQDAATGTGTVLLRIENLDTGRAIAPTVTLADFVDFSIVFTRGGVTVHGEWDRDDVTGAVTVEAELATGAPWALAVTAYLPGATPDAPNLPAASFAGSVTIVEGETTIAPIALTPIRGEGLYGTFSWSITFPDGVTSGSVSVRNPAGTTIVRTVPLPVDPVASPWAYAIPLPASDYFVLFTLNRGADAIATASQDLHVYRNMTSHFSWVFVDGDFHQPIPVESVTITGEGVEPGVAAGAFTLSMTVGDYVELGATVSPPLATDPTVIFAVYSGGEYVEWNAATRTLTAIDDGVVVITATAPTDNVTSTLTVTIDPVPEPAEVPFTWNFNAPAGPAGWPASIPTGTGTGAVYQNTTLDVAYTNNMTLLAGSIDSGIVYGPLASQGTALENVPVGRIQVTANPGAANPFLSIARVQGPFTLSIVISGTGASQGTRPVRAYVDGAEIGRVDIYTAEGTSQNWRRGTFTYTGTGLVEIDLRTNNGIRLYQVALTEVQDEQLPPHERLAGTPGNLNAVRTANAANIAWDMQELNDAALMTHFAGLNNRMVNSVHTVGGQTIVVSTDAGYGPQSGNTHDSQSWGWAALTILRPNMTLGLNYVLHITGRAGIDGEALSVNPGQMGLWPDRTATMTLTNWGQSLPTPFTITHELTAAQAAGTPNVEIRWNLNAPELNPLPPTFAISIDDMVIVRVEAADYELARAALGAAITAANLRVQLLHTLETWGPFAAALAAAQTAMTYTVIADIVAAREALEYAMGNLLPVANSPEWQYVLDNFMATGNGHGGHTVVASVAGITAHGRAANHAGIGLNVVAMRELSTEANPDIVITGVIQSGGNFQVLREGGNWEEGPTGNTTSVTISGTAPFIAGTSHRLITNPSTSHFTVTGITVGGVSILDLPLPPDPDTGINIDWPDFEDALDGATVLDTARYIHEGIWEGITITNLPTSVAPATDVRWYFGAVELGTGATLNLQALRATVPQFRQMGVRTITVVVMVGDVPFSRHVNLTINP